MRRVSLFLTTLVLAALLLAACGGQETTTSIPSTNVPPVTMESTSTMEATEAATEAATEPPATDLTTTPAVPVTGENSLARISNLIGTSVCGMGGDQLGTVQDLVLDFDQAPALVTYMIVDANGRNVAVPYSSFATFSATGTGMGSGTGTGTGTGTDTTSTPQAGTTDTTATADPNATSTTGGTGTGTGTGTDMTGQQNCLTLNVDNDMFTNAPDFDQSTMPAQGQSAAGWDTSISGYWQGGGTGTGTGTGTQATDTPAAGTDVTAVPTTTASTGGTGTGTATGTGQGAQQMQGVVLASDVLGATVTVSPQGNDQGTGTGTGTGTDTTSTPQAGTTDTTATADPNATATTGGTGTGTGTGSTMTGDFSQGTVQDVIIEPEDGDLEYLVVSFGTDERYFPIPIGFLRWDAATSGIVLMVNGTALQNAPAFSADQFPDTSTSGWDQQWEDFWTNNGGTGTGTGSGGVTIATATP